MAPTTLRLAALALSILTACSVPGGRGRPTSAAAAPDYPAFLQACKDATTDAVVMNLAAHPDDESARSLVFLRRKFGVRTVTVYSTCGEGGQNAVGREIGLELARIRTRETLAAARITGTRVRWLGFADFGYSKTAAEAFKVWGKAAYLQRLSAVLDAERPDVVLTNHSPQHGHGHHRASVIALRELVADKARQGWVVPVYQRARRGAAVPARGAGPDPAPRPPLAADIRFDVGEVDYMTGRTYAQQATRAWREHRTQGVMGGFSSARRTPDSWQLVHPANGSGARFFAFLGSVFDEPEFQALTRQRALDLDDLREEFDQFHRVVDVTAHVDRAARLLPTIEDLLAGLRPGGEAHDRLQRRRDALQRVILEGRQVKISARLDQDSLAAGGRGVIGVEVTGPAVTVVGTLAGRSVPGVRSAAEDVTRIAIPFGPLAQVDEDSVVPSWFRPQVTLQVHGRRITREVPVRYTPVPRVALELKRPVRLVPTAAHGKRIEASVEIAWNGHEPLDAALLARATDGLDVRLAQSSVRLGRSDKTERKVHIQLPDHALRNEESIVLALDSGRSELRLRPVDVRAPADLFVGLIRGPDDTLRLALDDLDIRFEELDASTLPNADLGRFSTVVVDIRAYRTRDDLRAQRDRILAFCKAGGRVLCFYHKPGEWNKTDRRPLLAPFDIQVGSARVCEEDARVTLLHPEHRLWNHPNKIVAADFEGWVQERGLNFPDKWADQWVPMMRMSDTGEQPLAGALLYARHGKGDYIYCSLALYRQLRQGHSGAARLLANLLSR